MNSYLDCIPCLMNQALVATRLVTGDSSMQEQIMRHTLGWAAEMDLSKSPTELAQHIHRRIRQATGIADPYLAAKQRFNRVCLELLPELRAEIQASPSPLMAAARLAIAGNMIDMGVNGDIRKEDIHQAMRQALSGPFVGDVDAFQQAVAEAKSILYLADNAGEIAFDRLLIEQISPARVTLAVRGAPVLNDVTLQDAQVVGLDKIVAVIDNGSDAPGTMLEDCSQEFRQCFSKADMIIAKGQGNFESLYDQTGNIFFLFKVKCPVAVNLTHQPLGTQILSRCRG